MSNAEDFDRMYKNMMDPDIREENQRKAARAKRIEERKLDTGAYVI